MGRYVSQSTVSTLTAEYADSSATFNAEGYLTAYAANNTTYSNITYETNDGGAADYGAVYEQVSGWTETNNINNSTQTVSVNYDSATGRVSSLTIT